MEGQAIEQCKELRESLSRMDVQTEYVTSDRNEFTDQGQSINAIQRIRSAKIQADIEAHWNNYMSKSHSRTFRLGMYAKRAFEYIRDVKKLERLANIDLSHLRLLTEGIASGASWILIMEDDGQIDNIEQAASIIKSIISHLDAAKPIFVNLSESIDTETLGVKAQINAATVTLPFDGGRNLVHLELPITNTVCANLYSAEFAQMFAEAISQQGIVPSIPIDWRMNKLILQSMANRDFEEITCFWVIPGLAKQGSMHAV